MKISQKGIDLIKKWESFRSEAYKCPAGVWTQGYGHTRTTKYHSQPISERTAEELLRVDILVVESELKPVIEPIELSQNQYDAVVSFCFNIGFPTFFKSSAFTIMILDANSKKIADSWIQYRNADGKYLRGLLLRRLDELQLYYSK